MTAASTFADAGQDGATFRIDDIIEAPCSNRPRNRIVFWCIVAMFFDGYDFNVLGFIGPSLMAQFAIGKPAFGLAASAGVVGFALGAFLLSDLGDRFGRKRMLVAGMAAFGTLTVACAFCDSFAWLVVLRLLTGVGLGGAVPNAVALGAEYARRGSKATIIGALFVGYALGGASPGWIAGWLLPILGWPSVLLVGGVPALLAVCLIATSLPESIGFLAADGRRRGELFRMLDRYHPGHGVPPDANIIAPESVRHGLPLRLLFTDGRALTTLLLWFSFVTTIAGLFFTITWTPTLVASMGLTGSHAAMILAVFLTSGALGCLLVTRVIDKVGVAGLIVCQLLAAAIVFTMGQVGTSSELLLALIAAFGGVFASGSQAGLNSIAGTYYPAAIRASGVGWALGIGRGGAIIAPILGGALLAAGTKPPSMFAISALLTAVSAMSMILLMVQRGSQLRDAAATVPGE